jgi:dienelactone hydrolase
MKFLAVNTNQQIKEIAQMLNQMQAYQNLETKDVCIIGAEKESGIERQTLVIQTPFGYRRMGELFLPEGDGLFPAVLYLHWYEPKAQDSNRSQFEKEAIEMAQSGTICMTVETLWSDLDFFWKRTQADDAKNSIEEVVNLRRFMDFLLSQPKVDARRFACVGHDFGGMYGVLAGSLDQRPTHYVIMAATPRFSDWYLYFPKLDGAAREAFVQQMSEIDPITHIADLSPAPILFQFGSDDSHVPNERAQEFFVAANDPKEMKVYEAGHGLNEQAALDRKAWLKEKLSFLKNR